MPTDESSEEIRREIDDLMSTPEMQAARECFTPRLYIDFTQPIEDAGLDHSTVPPTARPVRITHGPYFSATVSDGKLTVYHSEPDGSDGQDFVLATADGNHWRLHDGSEGTHRFFLRINTCPPT